MISRPIQLKNLRKSDSIVKVLVPKLASRTLRPVAREFVLAECIALAAPKNHLCDRNVRDMVEDMSFI